MTGGGVGSEPLVRDRWRTAAWVLFALACAANLYGLFAPSQPGPGLPGGLDKVAHAASFASIMITGMFAGIRAVPLAIVLTVHAIGSELLQGWLLADRAADPWDVVADLVGVGLGWVAMWLSARSAARRRAGG